MAVNIDKLFEKMRECRMTQEELCKKLHINPSTFYRKIKSMGTKFTIGEMHAITDILSLSDAEAVEIFLAKNSQ